MKFARRSGTAYSRPQQEWIDYLNSDNFNRSGPGLGSNWIASTDGSAALEIQSNHLRSLTTHGSIRTAYWPGPDIRDQFAQVYVRAINIVFVPVSGNVCANFGLVCRHVGTTFPAQSGYCLAVFTVPNTWAIGRYSQHTTDLFTDIQTSGYLNTTLAVNDLFRFEVIADWGYAYQNGVLLGSCDLSASGGISINALGRPGAFGAWFSASGGGINPYVDMDDWSGGTLNAPDATFNQRKRSGYWFGRA